jgi:hypothetical protein
MTVNLVPEDGKASSKNPLKWLAGRSFYLAMVNSSAKSLNGHQSSHTGTYPIFFSISREVAAHEIPYQ